MKSLDLEPLSIRSICAAAVLAGTLAGAQCVDEPDTDTPTPQGIDIGTGSLTK